MRRATSLCRQLTLLPCGASQVHTAARAARKIDVHAHAVFDSTTGAAGDEYGPELGWRESDGQPFYRIGTYFLRGINYQTSPFMDLDKRIERMDQDGIDMQLLSPNPLTFFHHIPADKAAAFCRQHNDAMAEAVALHSDRLLGSCQLPMQCPDMAIAELERSVQQLGLLGGYIGTEFGMALDDSRLDPFYARCVELDVPLFMHPAPRGIDGPAGDDRLSRFELDIVIGFNLESSVAICSLLFGGVLQRHPKLDICFPSGGGAIPFLLGRMSRAVSSPRPWVSAELMEPGVLEASLRRLWFDSHVHDDGAFQLLRTHVGDEHLVYGTNFSGWDQDQGLLKPPQTDGVDLVGNACRLLRL